jgi:hypothetical protein
VTDTSELEGPEEEGLPKVRDGEKKGVCKKRAQESFNDSLILKMSCTTLGKGLGDR